MVYSGSCISIAVLQFCIVLRAIIWDIDRRHRWGRNHHTSPGVELQTQYARASSLEHDNTGDSAKPLDKSRRNPDEDVGRTFPLS